LFTGNIKEIRLSSTETQNVITYPVVVTASNSDLKLLPGMTAYLSFEVQEAKDVIRVPWAALRFFPPREDLVRENDRQLVAGNTQKREDDGDSINMTEDPPVSELVEARVNQRRHVWIERDGELAAVEVSIGISDYQYAVLLEGDLKPGQNVVTGVKVSRR
jgi:HlyD family secretion protein